MRRFIAWDHSRRSRIVSLRLDEMVPEDEAYNFPPLICILES